MQGKGGDLEEPGTGYLRAVPLLPGEVLEGGFSPRAGLVSEVPEKGPFLALTSRRVICFTQEGWRGGILLASLGEIKGVSLRSQARNPRTLWHGLLFFVAGVLAYFFLGLLLEGLAVALAVGGVIVLLGIVLILRYALWEEEGSIAFQAGSWELVFPYRGEKAASEVFELVNLFFELKGRARGLA